MVNRKYWIMTTMMNLRGATSAPKEMEILRNGTSNGRKEREAIAMTEYGKKFEGAWSASLIGRARAPTFRVPGMTLKMTFGPPPETGSLDRSCVLATASANAACVLFLLIVVVLNHTTAFPQAHFHDISNMKRILLLCFIHGFKVRHLVRRESHPRLTVAREMMTPSASSQIICRTR